MLKKFDVDLQELDDNAMYDINDFIRNFQQFGRGLTFDEMIDFFLKKELISKDKVIEFIKKNFHRMTEIELMTFTNSAVEKFRQMVINSLPDDFCSNETDNKVKSTEKYQGALDTIIKSRELDYNYFKEYVKRLKDKGITYLSLIKFIGNNKEEQKNQYYWESLLSELDINYDGTKIKGEDIKRILNALFNCQIKLEDKLKIANNLETYKGAYLNDYTRIAAKFGSDEVYPSSSILAEFSFLPGFKNLDGTSIEMSKRQYEEARTIHNERTKEFMKEVFSYLNNRK